MADDRPIHELRFDAAVRVIQSLPRNGPFQPSNDMMLKFYSYYKQATQGPCRIPRPGFWDPVGKVKWDAWNSLGDMPREKAMIAYVDEMKEILETLPVTDKVEELLEVLGPFYDVVEGGGETPDLTLDALTSSAKSVTQSTGRTLSVNDKADASDTSIESEGDEVEESEEEESEEEEEEQEKEEEKVEKEKDVARLKADSIPAKAHAPLSNGSVEHSLSSMTNGTHSSLNSECLDEELAFSLQPSQQPLDFNGHLSAPRSDRGEDATGPQHLASDSDGEVYCDSMEQLGLEEGSGVLINHSLETGEVSNLSGVEQGLLGEAPVKDDLQEGSNCIQHGGEEGTPGGHMPHRERLSTGRPDTSLVRRGRASRSSGAGSGGGARGGLPGGGDGDGERWGSEGGAEGSLNEQIAAALARLQEDMQSVLQRLHTLEALTASQTRSLSLQQSYPSPSVDKKPPWWPFDVSPGTVAFAVVWPFVVHWLVWLYLQRRRRKMN
ncbi:acyl-CoA-binding domain-containing protein 5A-like isoform X1 [Megalops cyprinoides]|uniref:acyl-CoA-binding domain-containing protein 5A-like isoform X1 n=1 Tax=Megalops cyprinoides TaxID=118141 RepID=UPI001863B1B0|nr:acyl-CoA-binding domain-containing protein 5A-like isoform X1 [Megalops cyprinoides]